MRLAILGEKLKNIKSLWSMTLKFIKGFLQVNFKDYVGFCTFHIFGIRASLLDNDSIIKGTSPIKESWLTRYNDIGQE